jgi:serine/threonine protein kinase
VHAVYPAAPGRTLDGRYTLVRRLGRGGTSSVWQALDQRLDRLVAVKLLEQTDEPDAAERFDREARITARLRSPHLVELFDYGFDGGQPFLVLELLEGRDLASRLREQGPLSVSEATRIVEQVAHVLALAHASGIVHRDVKPANVFLCAPWGVVKMLDFGAGKNLLDGRSLAGTACGWTIGTPAFMSPEQIDGRSTVGPWTDVWALACVAYTALAGSVPFAATASSGVVQRVLEDDPEPISGHGLPAALDAVFAWGLAKEPAVRCRDALAFATALHEATRTGLTPSSSFARSWAV